MTEPVQQGGEERGARVRFVVVVGTDTGVGKTLVSTGLVVPLLRSGRRVIAIKPIESGCSLEISELEDGVALARSTQQSQPSHALVRLRDPITPALAAEREGIAIDLPALARSIVDLAGDADTVVVEGAGGVLSPLGWKGNDALNITHLARMLGASALLVGSDRLGTLHHVLAAHAALGHAKLSILGLVLSAPELPDASTGTNLQMLRRLLPELPSAAVPRVSSAEEAALHLAAVADWIGCAPQ